MWVWLFLNQKSLFFKPRSIQPNNWGWFTKKLKYMPKKFISMGRKSNKGVAKSFSIFYFLVFCLKARRKGLKVAYMGFFLGFLGKVGLSSAKKVVFIYIMFCLTEVKKKKTFVYQLKGIWWGAWAGAFKIMKAVRKKKRKPQKKQIGPYTKGKKYF